MLAYIKELSTQEQEEMRDVLQKLYRQTFILERRYDRRAGRIVINKEYYFCEKHMDFLKEYLGEKVSDVQITTQLADHAVTIVPDGGMSFEMEKYFKAMDPENAFQCGRILQLNPNHCAVMAMRDYIDSEREKAQKYAEVLYSQGLLIAGLTVEDPIAYSALICELLK